LLVPLGAYYGYLWSVANEGLLKRAYATARRGVISVLKLVGVVTAISGSYYIASLISTATPSDASAAAVSSYGEMLQTFAYATLILAVLGSVYTVYVWLTSGAEKKKKEISSFAEKAKAFLSNYSSEEGGNE